MLVLSPLFTQYLPFPLWPLCSQLLPTTQGQSFGVNAGLASLKGQEPHAGRPSKGCFMSVSNHLLPFGADQQDLMRTPGCSGKPQSGLELYHEGLNSNCGPVLPPASKISLSSSMRALPPPPGSSFTLPHTGILCGHIRWPKDMSIAFFTREMDS